MATEFRARMRRGCRGTLDRITREAGKVKAVREPHSKRSPKEALIDASRNAGKRPLYSANDNPNLMKTLDLEICADRCRAFAELQRFVRDELTRSKH
jgi:hypothetical protein